MKSAEKRLYPRASTAVPKRRGMIALGGLFVITLLAIGVLAVIPAAFPGVGANTADLLRGALGPQPVAVLESTSFQIQDAINQLRSRLDGGRVQISLSSQRQSSLQASGKSGESAPMPAAIAASAAATLRNGAAQSPNVVWDAPNIGWQAYGPSVNGGPVMAQALLTLDPQRPYAAIVLVRVDLSKVQLHVVPGFLEPSHDPTVLKAISNPGTTPSADLGQLIAGFNGGFKAVNGHYGMMVDGVTLLPPVPGIATLAVYNDGQVRIGVWGTDILPSPNMVAYRQNCPPIIQAGQINPLVSVNNPSIWGETISNQDVTWRTAVGISQDGHYLIYAVGNATGIPTLAEALQQAGAYNAMQLDINRHYAHFVTYQATSHGSMTAIPLLDQMENVPTLYLVAHSRDYFYLTAK